MPDLIPVCINNYVFTETYRIQLENPVAPAFKSGGITLGKEFELLKEDLALYNRQLSKEIGNRDSIFELIRNLIQVAVENALKTGETLDSVRKQMNTLCYTTGCVPTRLSDWAVQEVNNVHKRLSQHDSENEVAVPLLPESKEQSPLLSMETLYHSSACCLAVNKCSASNFRDLLNTSGHHLREASMSVSKESSTDRCLIAFQDSIMYVAFQSEPTLEHWIQSPYSCFEEGESSKL